MVMRRHLIIGAIVLSALFGGCRDVEIVVPVDVVPQDTATIGRIATLLDRGLGPLAAHPEVSRAIAVTHALSGGYVLRFPLSATYDTIRATEFLDCNHPAMRQPTTGVVVGDTLPTVNSAASRTATPSPRLGSPTSPCWASRSLLDREALT